MKLHGTSREISAEFLGTFTLMLIGLAVNAQVFLSEQSAGSFLSINIGWGLGVTFGVYVAGGVSGAHLNPAVTVALAMCRGFPWAKVVPYIIVQTLAAFAAAAVVYGTYFEALHAFEVAHGFPAAYAEAGRHAIETAGIFATYPQEFLSTYPGGLVDQIVGTAVLLLCIFALTDVRNLAPDPRLAPLMIGLIVTAVGLTFGFNCGYAINPARDFGPRVFTMFAGWGTDVFRANDYFWWVPIVGPLIGGVVGAVVYDALVTRHHPTAAEQPD
ncbi:MAG: MIP family channel protein [Pirellulales bacterium]